MVIRLHPFCAGPRIGMEISIKTKYASKRPSGSLEVASQNGAEGGREAFEEMLRHPERSEALCSSQT